MKIMNNRVPEDGVESRWSLRFDFMLNLSQAKKSLIYWVNFENKTVIQLSRCLFRIYIIEKCGYEQMGKDTLLHDWFGQGYLLL